MTRSLAALAVILGGLMAPSVGAAEANSLQSPGVKVTPSQAFTDACSRYSWLCDAPSYTLVFRDRLAERALAHEVNKAVNHQIEQVDDIALTGRAEYWSLPRAGRGDCEDLVLEKMSRLLRAGVAPERLSIAVVLDHNGENHAVLLFESANGVEVLDSLTDRVVPPEESGYRFLARQSVNDRQSWQIYAPERRVTAQLSAKAVAEPVAQAIRFGAR